MNEYKLKTKIKQLGPEFFLTSLAQGLYLLQSLIQNKIFTSFFETQVFGQWSLIVSAYTLVSMVPFSALDIGIYKVAYKCKTEDKENQLYSLIGFVYCTGFVIYSIIFVIMQTMQGESFFASGYLIPFSLYAFSEILKNTFVIIDNAYRNRTRVLWIRIFGITSRTALFLTIHKIGVFNIGNVLWILVITNVIVLLYQNKYIRQITTKIDSGYIKQLTKNIMSFSGPLLTWAIFGWMQNMISRWYLDALLDLESVAMYSVLTTLSYFVPNAVYTIVNAYIMPIVFQNDRAFNRKGLLKYMGLVFMPMFLYWILISFFGKYLILLLTDEKYLQVCTYLPYTTMTAILYVSAMLSTVEIYRRGETKKLILPTIMPGLFMATVGYFYIQHWGFIGAVINYMSGHIIYLILTSIVVFSRNNINP